MSPESTSDTGVESCVAPKPARKTAKSAPKSAAPKPAPEPAPTETVPSAALEAAPEATPAVEASEVEAAPTDEVTAPNPPRRRIVVAEDEAIIRLDLVEMLREQNYDVVGEAGDGEAAVRLVEELRPDLVVMDIKMPILDGISAAERIVKARIAPVVLLTAFSQAELVERARDAGAMAYVVKPFTADTLMPSLEVAMSRHQEIVALEHEVADITEQFETRKQVERAKGLLMQSMGLSEPEAFRWIQKTAMNRRMTMREVANVVIEQASKPSR